MRIAGGTLDGWKLGPWRREPAGRGGYWARWWTRGARRRLAARVWFWRGAPPLAGSPRGSWSYEYRERPRAKMPAKGSGCWGGTAAGVLKAAADYFIGNTVGAIGVLPKGSVW